MDSALAARIDMLLGREEVVRGQDEKILDEGKRDLGLREVEHVTKFVRRRTTAVGNTTAEITILLWSPV